MGMRAPFTVTAGTQAAAPPPSTVTVQLTDTGANSAMSLTPSSSVGAAGDITFTVTNTGTIEHEMIILKTDTPFDQLPVADAGDPPAPGHHRRQQGRRSRTTSARPATRTSNRARPAPSPSTSTAGKYVLVCNLADHYQMGMRAPFTVR